jgi:hypothetical protein
MSTSCLNSQPQRAMTAWMLRARQRYPRSWAPWTAEEDELLRALTARQASQEEQEAALGRGPGGLSSRRQILGLEPRSPVPRRRARALNLPVPQMDWVPDWRDHLPERRWIGETARFWGVPAQALDNALEDLDLEEWMVFTLRYGLSERCSYTLEAVGELLDLAPRSVRLLQEQAEETVRRSLAEQGHELRACTLEETLARRRARKQEGPS